MKATAKTCPFTKTCTNPGCSQVHDITDKIVKIIIIAGLADDELRRQVLSVIADLDDKSLDETVQIIENKEMYLRATSHASSATHSWYHGSSVAASTSTGKHTPDFSTKLSQVVKCTKCGKDMKKYKIMHRKFGKPRLREFKQCIACWKQSKQPEAPDGGNRCFVSEFDHVLRY